jgi:hypothetical protein
MVWLIALAALAFVWHCPIFKPWFGFRRPPGHAGRWWT